MNLLKWACCVIVMCSTLSVSAQKYFYVNIGVTSGTNFIEKYSNTSYPEEISNPIPFPSFNGLAGYSINKRFSVELAINQFSYIDNTEGPFQNWSDTAKMIRLMPMIKYLIPFKIFSVYAKIGMSIGFDNKMTSYYSWYNDVPPFNYGESTTEYWGGISPGYVLALGGEIKIYRNLRCYVELNGIYNKWSTYHLSILESIGETNIYNSSYIIVTAGVNFGLKYNFW